MSKICPYCQKEMQEGMIIGDGRNKVRWEAANKKMGIIEKMITDKGCLEANYTLAHFQIEANYCAACGKIIIDNHIKE